MTKKSIEAQLEKLAVDVYEEKKKVLVRHYMQAILDVDVHKPFPQVTVEEKQEMARIVEDGELRIADFLAMHLTIEDVRLLAAKYLIQATALRRSDSAKTEALASTRNNVKLKSVQLLAQKVVALSLRQKNRRLPEETRRAQAKEGGIAKNKSLNEARQFVRTEWALHQDQYMKNKSAFARDYVGRVRNEFLDSKGDPLEVTEKTLREVWLKNPPTAGSSA